MATFELRESTKAIFPMVRLDAVTSFLMRTEWCTFESCPPDSSGGSLNGRALEDYADSYLNSWGLMVGMWGSSPLRVALDNPSSKSRTPASKRSHFDLRCVGNGYF